MSHRPEPDALAVNPRGRTWTHRTTAAGTPAAVAVDHAAREITAPAAPTERAHQLRTLALVRAALDPIDPQEFHDDFAPDVANRARTSEAIGRRAITAANTWRVHKFAADRDLVALDTMTDPYGRRRLTDALEALEHDRSQIAEAIAIWAAAQGTADARAIAAEIGRARPDLRGPMRNARRRILAQLAALDDGDQNNHARTWGRANYSWHAHAVARTVAPLLARLMDHAAHGHHTQPGTEPGQGPTTTPRGDRTERLWKRHRIERPPLTRPQLGTLARSNRYRVDHGRIISAPSRLYTDPLRRAFYRRTRGNGATIVLDISGSMSLDTDDVAALLIAAPGARVWTYHAHGSDGEVTLLAADGLAVDLAQPLPVWPGGSNGIDGPALAVAVAHHKHPEPFLWVTDGLYNGMNRTAPDAHLAADILAALAPVPYANTYDAIPDAVNALERIARGGHPDAPNLPTTITTYQKATR